MLRAGSSSRRLAVGSRGQTPSTSDRNHARWMLPRWTAINVMVQWLVLRGLLSGNEVEMLREAINWNMHYMLAGTIWV